MKFRIRLLITPLLLSFMIAAPGRAQEALLEMEAEELAAPEAVVFAETATPAMWRVTDEDSEYILLGTLHFLPRTLNWRNDALTDAFENADTIYFEANPDDAADMAKIGAIFRAEGANPPGVSLLAMLETADAIKLREISQELQLDFRQIEVLRPWNAFLALSLQLIHSQGFDPASGVDRALINEAKIAGKDVRYFETMSEQIGFFTQFDAKTERDMLVITIRNWEDERDSMGKLIEAWAQGDTEFVDTSLNQEMQAKVPAAYDALIADRNIAWSNELDAALKNESGTGLVAVGVAHLVGGEFSLPALLAAKGYEVTPYGVDITPEELIEVMPEVAPEIAPDAAPEAANDNEPSE